MEYWYTLGVFKSLPFILAGTEWRRWRYFRWSYLSMITRIVYGNACMWSRSDVFYFDMLWYFCHFFMWTLSVKLVVMRMWSLFVISLCEACLWLNFYCCLRSLLYYSKYLNLHRVRLCVAILFRCKLCHACTICAHLRTSVLISVQEFHVYVSIMIVVMDNSGTRMPD